MVVALDDARRGRFISIATADGAPPAAGIETTESLDSAKRFADGAALAAWVAAHGGDPAGWIAWTLP